MLAALQFTVAVDFVIMMPLGPQLMRIFGIDTPAFNFAVSAYAGAAGVSGLCAAFFLDRFDRKTALLMIYAGFAIGTLLCALARTYETLVFARALAGFFGGIVGGISLAMVGDLVPDARRASAIGTVMSGFSLSYDCRGSELICRKAEAKRRYADSWVSWPIQIISGRLL